MLKTTLADSPRLSQVQKRWQSLALEVADPDVELDTELFAIVFATYRELQRAGHPFDVMLVAMMRQMHRQASRTEDACDGIGDDQQCDNEALYGLAGVA